MAPMSYYRFTGTNIPPLEILKSYNLRMSANEYKSIAIIVETICSSDILDIEVDEFIGDNQNFQKIVWTFILQKYGIKVV